jgi:hypothetical protein
MHRRLTITILDLPLLKSLFSLNGKFFAAELPAFIIQQYQ